MAWGKWIHVFDDETVCPDLDAVYAVFREIAIPPGVMRAPAAAALHHSIDGLPPVLARVFSGLAEVIFRRLRLEPDAYDIECWSNRSIRAGPDVDYHVDNDEGQRRRTGIVHCPLFGSILYLGPPHGPESGAIGGTWFNAPLEDTSDDADLFGHPVFTNIAHPHGRGVRFRAGRVVVFNGRSPHCVMPFETEGPPRVSLLCNVWPKVRKPS